MQVQASTQQEPRADRHEPFRADRLPAAEDGPQASVAHRSFLHPFSTPEPPEPLAQLPSVLHPEPLAQLPSALHPAQQLPQDPGTEPSDLRVPQSEQPRQALVDSPEPCSLPWSAATRTAHRLLLHDARR